MEITTESLPWDSENVALFRAFLLTPTGQRLVPKLTEGAPSLLPGGDTNAVLIRCGEFRGYQEVVKTLLSLAVNLPDAPKSETNYPPLDDDVHWNDGEKSNT
jgi:hypothetical protein